MIAGSTGWCEPQNCGICGVAVEHRQMIAHSGSRAGTAWWSAARHKAPCGAPCIGGGVRPKSSEALLPGVSGIAHVHRAMECGTLGCVGGKGGV